MNICKFISTQKHGESINIINFVYEKEARFKQDYILLSTYTLALVTKGTGFLHTNSGTYAIGEGDLFMTFPARAYYIENSGNLQYIYISFTGLRAQALMQRLKISYTSPVFYEFGFLIDTWEKVFSVSNDKNNDLFCESLILYSFAHICRDTEEHSYEKKVNNLLLAKQYIDLNYTDSDLNLRSISEKFSYSPKYFSAAFKKMVRINFSEYLRIKRLSYAVILLEGGITNTSDLAELCGYKEPLYFSKSFKMQYGMSPKQWYRKNIPMRKVTPQPENKRKSRGSTDKADIDEV